MNSTVVFGSVAIVGSVLVLWWGLSAKPSAARANLFAGLSELDPETARASTLIERVGRMSRRVTPKPLLVGLERNLVQAGHPHGLDLGRMLGVKAVFAGATALLLILAGSVGWALSVGAVMYFLPDYWLLSTRDKRQAAMRAEAADVIDQLTICVEAGLGFDAAIARVAHATTGVLALELRRTLGDVQAGVPRAQALRMLAERAQIEEIRQLVTALLQAQKHGVPLAETLRTQSAEMRLKRKQRTEEKAAKLTVKMIFPIVFCFMPVFMIITMVPAILSLIDAF